MRLSIITINRNNAKGLAQTIDSVVCQIRPPDEFIVVDGASTDGSVDVIRSFEKKITRSVSEPDNGIYQAMNKGIGISSGTYLLFLNSGDRLFSESILSDIESGGYTEDIVFGDIVYEGSAEPVLMPDKIDIGVFLGKSIGHGAAFIRRTLFDRFGLYDEANQIVSDWAFFLKALIIGSCTYRHVSRIFTIYQQGGVSTDASFGGIQQQERDKMLESLFPHFHVFFKESLNNRNELEQIHHSAVFRWLEIFRSGRLNQYRRRFFLTKGK